MFWALTLENARRASCVSRQLHAKDKLGFPSDCTYSCTVGYDIMPELRMLYAHMAACANSFATDLQAHQGHAKVHAMQYGSMRIC